MLFIFQRRSGDFHKVTAPSSPTPGSTPQAPLAYSSGPLPFEMKPYMPPDSVIFMDLFIYSFLEIGKKKIIVFQRDCLLHVTTALLCVFYQILT